MTCVKYANVSRVHADKWLLIKVKSNPTRLDYRSARVDAADRESRLIQVTYIEDNGASHTIDVREGQSLMDAATKHRIPGIDGDCGGACACATCHVYVAPEWFERLVPMKDLERKMLKFASMPKENSRLACQIIATPALNGLSVTIPISQY